jgi:large subunit ribosomal protein L15
MAKELNLSSLKPAQGAKARKRVGRGLGSGKGRYSGRGIKGQKARAGSHKMRAGFEGGQMPLYMRVGKQRGSTSKDAMPIGPFRTSTAPVNVGSLDAFDDGAEVTPEVLAEKGLIRNTKIDVKLLGNGELTKRLTIRVHAISATAREKVEKAGGTVSLLKEPAARRPVRAKRGPVEGARGNREVPSQGDGVEPGSEPEQTEQPGPEKAH